MCIFRYPLSWPKRAIKGRFQIIIKQTFSLDNLFLVAHAMILEKRGILKSGNKQIQERKG
ncbi:hypothetical protein A7K91_11435 [Paenibacillus oryzae]|uniref:Uncharacterized protein n=1 Tax=Paenibacillus oryzae TaxID=1844972 RepID=A0A1A5YF35_9BACL|nr:hypothetical protein A7K91_11435 [Paenibacillus oryzae]